ncbi:MAG: acyl-CoA desaturase [Planctomycetota bacterium]|mgnify:CR=1 FL=1|nr:acyl-CoA desaturase [Planctomycetota bacterium]
MTALSKRRPHFLLTVSRWFDSWAGAEGIPKDEPQKVDWVRCIPFLAMHLAFVALIWVGWSPFAVLFALGLYVVRMFAITGFYHRYFSHKTFKTSRAFQFVFALWGNSAVQRGPLWWAAHHRLHHKHSDHAEDVHSPHHNSFWWSHIGWIMSRANFATHLSQVPELAKFPELRFLDRFDSLVPMALFAGSFGLGMLLEYSAPGLGTSGFQLFVWTVISTVVLFHGTCTINSLSHMFGTRRFETTDKSRNNPLLAIITLGEGWHNNHHHYPNSARNGFKWWEYDVTYYTLKVMSWCGIIWDLKPVPVAVMQSARRRRSS